MNFSTYLLINLSSSSLICDVPVALVHTHCDDEVFCFISQISGCVYLLCAGHRWNDPVIVICCRVDSLTNTVNR